MKGRKAHLIVRANDLVSDFELALGQDADVEDVATEDLDVGHDELCASVDEDGASVALLAARLGVEVGAVEEETNRGRGGGEGGRRGEEGRGVIDALDGRADGGGA